MDLFVKFFKEVDRIEILAAAVLVGDPLPFIAAVIQVQHRSYRVDAQAIDVIFVEPEQRIRGEEIANLIAAVVKNLCTPVGVFALTRIGMLVKRGAVEVIEAVAIFGEVGRHPVDQYADVVLMQMIDKILEIFGLAIPTRGSIIADRLIAPTSGKRMLADRHQFDVRETHHLAITDQAVS